MARLPGALAALAALLPVLLLLLLDSAKDAQAMTLLVNRGEMAHGTPRLDWIQGSTLDDTAMALFREAVSQGAVEARGKAKKMNRALMALVVAYTLKFLFLVPTMIGGLILLKFTAALAGFFYALFATVLGLDPPAVPTTPAYHHQPYYHQYYR